MKQTKLLKNCTLALAISLTTGLAVTGCAEKDLYDPNYGKTELPAPETLPDFSNWSAINLNVDYQMPGYKVLVEVYTENPYEETADGKFVKTTSLPQFAAFTDDDSKFVGKMELPAGTKKVYLCTPAMGLPSCLQLDVTDGNVVFKLADLRKEEVQSRATSPSGNVPYPIEKQLYSLCQWNQYGKPNSNSYITDGEELKTLSEMLKRTKTALWKGNTKPTGLDNSNLLRSEKVTNITILKNAVDDKGATVEVESAKIKLTFLNEGAYWQNTLGYYYYKTGETPNVNTLKKYIIYPNVSLGGHHPFLLGKDEVEGSKYYQSFHAPLQLGNQVMLKFFGADGTATPTEDFPSGYTIGWFVIADAFRPVLTSGSGNLNTNADCLYSNLKLNSDGTSRCITLTDGEAKKVIVGFEDGADKSYEDVLFYVDADPSFAIFDPERPVTPPDPLPDKPEEETKEGTLLFEDNWPSAGDYDMNDVAVTYKRVITFNSQNRVTKIEDTFTPVQKEDAATKTNAFAFQVDGAQVGSFASLPDGVVYEKETNSFILFPSAANVRDKAFVITRTFDGSIDKKDLKKYNPYIIPDYVFGSKLRKEVHLPKMPATIYADKSLVGSSDDAYYILRNGKFPFALEVPTMKFVLVTERTEIGTKDEYPNFNLWVEKGCGDAYATWYLDKK